MITRNEVAAAIAVAAVSLGIGGGIAATHALSSAASKTPAVPGPHNGPVVDLPEPGDVPDRPGQ
jgi:hypothetical protein